MRRLLPLLASLLTLALAPAAAQAFTFYDWTLPATPTSLAITSDGTVYYTTANSGDVGRATLGGLPLDDRTAASGTSRPAEITVDPDGNLWFADPADDKIGRVDGGSGAITQLGTVAGLNDPVDVAAAPNRNVWAVENGGSGSLDCVTAGAVTPNALPSPAAPTAIAVATDGAIWFAYGNHIARATPTGTDCTVATTAIKPFSTPGGITVSDIATGPDGAMYIAGGTSLYRVSTDAGGTSLTQTQIALNPTTTPTAMHTDAGGNVWFVDSVDARIGEVGPQAVAAQEWALPRSVQQSPAELAFAPDGKAVYYAASSALGRFSPETGDTGPKGDKGDSVKGDPGDKGDPGATGGPGPQGGPGAPGPTGATGVAGPAGLRGGTGPQGPRGATGRRGKPGAVRIPKISCKLRGKRVSCRVVVGSRGGGGSGGGSGGGTTVGGGESRLRLTLTRGHRVYARAARSAKGTATVRLHRVRRVRAGRYTLVVTLGRAVTVRVPMRIG